MGGTTEGGVVVGVRRDDRRVRRERCRRPAMRSDAPRWRMALFALSVGAVWSCGSDTTIDDATMGGTESTSTSRGSTFGTTAESTTGDPCDAVHEGDLRIDETTDLATVDGVRIVTGDLGIFGVANRDLHFLRCLEEVNGDVAIGANPLLETLTGAERLAVIGPAGDGWGALRIVSNPLLKSLRGLDQLESVQWMLLSDNAVLDSIGLPSLERIEHGLTMGGCATVNTEEPAIGTGSNPMLTEFDGLDSLRYVGYLSIHGQENLTSLARLRELAEGGTTFGSLLEIGINPKLSAAEISAFVEAAGITNIDGCQNKDDAELCLCLPD